MKNANLLLIALLLPGSLFAGKKDSRPVPVVAKAQAVVDGIIAKGEYPASFTDDKTGVTVHWMADSNNLYCALQSPGQGWLAMGFGSDGMNGADMVIAFVDDKGAWAVEEDEGKSFFRHSKYPASKLLAAKAGLTDGKTVMEFSLPLKLSNGQEITPGKPLPYILAYHQSKTALSKHSKKSSGLLVLTSGQ
jgi:hypothetical protein